MGAGEAAPSSEPAVRKGPGRLLVVASSDIFADPWLDKARKIGLRLQRNATICAEIFLRSRLLSSGIRSRPPLPGATFGEGVRAVKSLQADWKIAFIQHYK